MPAVYTASSTTSSKRFEKMLSKMLVHLPRWTGFTPVEPLHP